VTYLVGELDTLPLVFAEGAGAAARKTMGTAVMGGTLAASLLAIFLIPVTFYVVSRVSDRRRKKELAKKRGENDG
jgi:HAE1 family hydrophobic/amphiphilic exporter-1